MRNFDSSHEQQVARRPHPVSPTLASVRVILVYHLWQEKLPGSDAGLCNIIFDTMKTLRRAGVHCDAWGVKDEQHLMTRLEAEEWKTNRPITHVVINPPLGYLHPKMIHELSRRWPNVEFVLLNHSGMAYISINQNAFEVIRDVLELEISTHNVFVAGNNTRFTTWLGAAFGQEGLYLPNLYNTESYIQPVYWRSCVDPLRIGSFGEARPWKNQLIAAEAALALGRSLRVNMELWVNQERWPNTASGQQSAAREQLYRGLPNAKLVTIPWTPWPQFRKIIGTMDILFSPSFDETFLCIAADGAAEGVPSVVTAAVEWCPRNWMSEPWDPASITSVGMSLLQNRIGAVHDGRRHLDTYVKNGLQLWIEYLTR